MYLNKAFIIGNLTRDPELKALPSGMQVASFSVATNRVWKDAQGGKQESVDYHNIVVFGKQAETSAQFLKKGSSALIEGRIQTRSWDGPDGKKNYRTEIVAERVQFGNRPGTSGAGSASSYNQPVSAPKAVEQASDDMIDYPQDEINPEDIPF